MTKHDKLLHPDAPLFHLDHPRPVSRRDFLRQGFISGAGLVVGSSLLGTLLGSQQAQAALSADLTALASNVNCKLGGTGGGIPFICIDLAGGANIAGSNVLVGQQGGQLDGLSTAGYNKLGLPGDMVPGGVEVTPTATSNGDYTDTTLGLAFHSNSAMLKGILEKAITGRGNIDGAVLPARSENDTGNNPHNPMYGIARALKQASSSNPGNQSYPGSVVTLVGSRNSDSGGNSMAPAMMIDPSIRPTKVDRPTDVTGMIDTGNLTAILDPDDVVPVMESMARLSNGKLNYVNTQLANDTIIKDLVRCGYIKSADIADRFAGVPVDPATDPDIVGATGVFSQTEFDSDGEFRKTASVMKMVLNGYAGAGTITMGGYDYHTGDRSTGELRDLRAGRCIGAILEYAARLNTPVMVYVCSDGSVFSNGMVDDSLNGGGKGVWTGDNQSTACSFFLVYNPGAPPQLIRADRQIGWFRADGSVETASSVAANNVNLLVETVILNYLALSGQQNAYQFLPFATLPASLYDSVTAFAPLG